jgi:hypothetical protein
VGNLLEETERLCFDESYRAAMQADYARVRTLLGGRGASTAVARAMVEALRQA